jgi:quercetin dioxygenase-like cupin family protein
MRQHTLVFWIIAAAVAICATAMTPSAKPQVGLERKILLEQDLAIPGYEVVLAQVTLAIGGREGRHSHPGTLVANILEGELTLELEGKPTKIVKAGESVLVEPGQVHEGFNKGSVPIKALATFIVEKGKPLATPAK